MTLGGARRWASKFVPTARDYVQDGLIAMWDAIENAGWGTHDAQLRCVDLTGNGYAMEFVGDCTVLPSSIRIDNSSVASYGIAMSVPQKAPCTQDICCSVESYDQFGRYIGENRGLILGGSGEIARVYGFGVNKNITLISVASVGNPFVCTLTISSDLTARHYLNGEEKGSIEVTTLGNYRGNITAFNRTTGGRGITGELNCLRLYSRVLTAAEIAANYEIDKARFNLPAA